MYNKTHKMILISLFAALTAVGALIKIPVPPVPFTLQFFFVILAGLILGARAGLASQVIYILIGLSGVPIFSGGGGIGYIFSPTFGYIIGFAAAAYIIGFIREKLFPGNKSFIKYIIASLIGLLVCYTIGLSYMFLILKYVNHAAPQISKLIVKGFIIFLPWDTVKIIAASWVAKETMRRLAFLNTQQSYLSNNRDTTSDF